MGHDLLEPTENAFLLLRGHANTAIAHLKIGRTPNRAEPKTYGFAGAELERIRQQVFDDLFGGKGIANGGNSVVYVGLDRAAFIGGLGLISLRNRKDQI